MALDYTALLSAGIGAAATYAVGRKQANTQRKIALQESIFLANQESGNQQYNMAIQNNPGSARARVAAAAPLALASSCGASASGGGDDGVVWIFLVLLTLGAGIVILARRALKKKGFVK